MKIGLDTNILVSGLLCPFSSSGEIVRMVSSGTLEICYEVRIISEYREVLLHPKFSSDQVHVDCLLEQIEACGHLASTEPLSKRLPNANDEPFLEAAIAGKARCLITGNLKHYPINKRQSMTVLLPTEFLELYRRQP